MLRLAKLFHVEHDDGARAEWGRIRDHQRAIADQLAALEARTQAEIDAHARAIVDRLREQLEHG